MRSLKVTLALGLLAGSLLVGAGARAQEDVELGPIPRPVSLFLLEKPTMTVSFVGSHGPVRVTGTLEGSPEEPLRVRSQQGIPREARWTEVRSLSIVEYPREGMPVGSYQASLVSDVGTSLISATTAVRDYTTQTGAWMAGRLPEGELTLSGRPYGSLSIPLTRVTAVQMEPIRGTVTTFPQGNLQLQVLDGKNVALPLQDVLVIQRDETRGTAVVTLADNQTFTGRLLDVPNVNIPITTPTGPVTIPLQRVAFLERTPPGGRL